MAANEPFRGSACSSLEADWQSRLTEPRGEWVTADRIRAISISIGWPPPLDLDLDQLPAAVVVAVHFPNASQPAPPSPFSTCAAFLCGQISVKNCWAGGARVRGGGTGGDKGIGRELGGVQRRRRKGGKGWNKGRYQGEVGGSGGNGGGGEDWYGGQKRGDPPKAPLSALILPQAPGHYLRYPPPVLPLPPPVSPPYPVPTPHIFN